MTLSSLRDGYPISMQFNLANPSANATTAMTVTGQGASGFVVPSGYVFRPMLLALSSNADLTAGTLTAKVTDNGTAIANGPEPALADATQRAGAMARITANPGIAAGHVVGVSLVADASYAPTTADHDVLLSGVLTPA